MTTIEVVDTALKIGLGAVVTAIGGIVALNKTQSHEIEQQRCRRIPFDTIRQAPVAGAGVVCSILERTTRRKIRETEQEIREIENLN